MMKGMDRAVVLFDGVCNFCNATINFVIDRDPAGKLAFASLQSDAGRKLLAEHGIAFTNPDPDSIVLIEGGRAYERSTAALRIAGKLRSPLAAFWVFLIVPRFVRDFFYSQFAKRRYRWFGRAEACRVPTPELRERFVDG